MNKKILYGFLFLMLCSLVSAMGVPHPVFGSITADGDFLNNAEVIIKNLGTGIQVTTNTDSSGRYQVDLGNFDRGFRDGDLIEVTLKYCDSVEICTKSFNVAGGNDEISWDITGEKITVNLPSDVNVVSPIQYKVCWDNSQIQVEQICPERVVCNDGSEVHSVEFCPEGELNWAIVAAIGIVIVGLGILWAYAAQKGIKAKYRWVPGMAGILKYKLNQYKIAKTKAERKKLGKTLLKYSETITKKYLDKL